MRLLILLTTLLFPTLANAQNCICLKCLALQHEMFRIPASSMSPTMEPGDCHIARRIAPDAYQPAYGDVVVFRHPVRGQPYAKRVIGLPGDTVELKNGLVILNESPLPQERLPDLLRKMVPTGPTRSMPLCSGETGPIERYRETLPGGIAYNILNLGYRRLDNWGPFDVPEGRIFLLGDHRDNSLDSRVPQTEAGLGFIPVENVYGIFEDLQ